MGGCLGCSWGVESKPITQINRRRSCTDVPFLLLFVALSIVMFVIFMVYLEHGADPEKLVRGVDYQGNVCKGDTPLTMWPDTDEYEFKVCISDCEETNKHALMVQKYDSTKVLWYCVPTSNSGFSIKGLSAPTDTMATYMADLEAAKWVVVSGIAIAIGLSVIYSWLLKKMAGVIIWVSIVLIMAGCIFVAISLFYAYNDSSDDMPVSEHNKLLGLGVGVCVFAFVFLCMVVFLRKRISIAIEVVAMSSDSLTDMHWLQVLPVYPIAILIVFFMYWIVEAITLFSVSVESKLTTPQSIRNLCKTENICEEYSIRNSFVHLEFNKTVEDAFAVHIVYLFWSVEFLFYIMYGIIAGAVADWYFTPGDRRSVSRTSPVWRSSKRVFRYHLGTIAFGSLVIAICQIIRSAFMAIEGSTRSRANGVQKALACVCGLCIKVVDCCVGKMSRSAFVFSSIYGDAFCHAAWNSASLLMRNIARVAAIHMVGDYLVILGKILVAMLSTGICGFILTRVEPYAAEVISPVFPLLLVFIFSYVISSIFMVIFETAMDTVFVCFLVDEECNKDSEGGMLASEELIALVDKYEEQSGLMAQKYATNRPPGAPAVELSEDQPKRLLDSNIPRSDDVSEVR